MSYKYRLSQEVTVPAIGRDWTFGRFTRKVWEEFSDYGQRRLPNPVKAALAVMDEVTLKDAAILRDLRKQDIAETDAAQKEGRRPVLVAPQYDALGGILWEKALALSQRYVEAGSPELRGLLRSPEGGSWIFYLLLKKNHPDIDEDTAYDVFWDLHTNLEAAFTAKAAAGWKPSEGDPGPTHGDDGRPGPHRVIEITQGRAPECLKNADSPASSEPPGR